MQKQERFDSLFRAYSRRVREYALLRGAARDELDDIVAETFLVCWRRLDDLPAEPLPWIIATARKVVANHRRAGRRRGALHDKLEEEAMADARRNTGRSDVAHAPSSMLSALETLSEDEREILMLVAWDGFSHAEVAQVLGCKRATVTVRIFRARSRLMKYLAPIRTHMDSEGSVSEAEA
jgi:RNA polymerase sigma-70 factor, ECF subfamily